MSAAQVHLSDYIAIIKKRKGVVIIFSFALISIVALFSYMSTPVYKATAQIIISKDISVPLAAGNMLDRDTRNDTFYQTQVNLLRSRGLALKVIEDLKLWEEFYRRPAGKGVLSDILPEPLSPPGEGGPSTVSAPDETADAQKPRSIPAGPEMSRIIDWYLGNLRIQPFRNSQLANISFLAPSPETAARVANAHARAFIEMTTQMKISAFKNGLNWIMNQLRQQKNILEASQSIMDMESEIMDMRDRLDMLKDKRQEIAVTYGPKHPKMAAINSAITQLEKEIETSKGKLAELGRAGPVKADINYEVLKQEVESDRQTYDFLLKQAKELGLASLLNTSNVSIVDEAEVPRAPVKPRTFLNIILAVVMSMFMGPFLAFFFEYMDNTVKTPEDVQRRLGIPVLGIIPFYKSKQRKRDTALFWDEPVKKKRKHAKTYYASDVANPLIPGIQMILQKEPGQAFFIQSATSGEGKTTVLANSALRLSRNGFSVLMVDADLRHPSLHRVFGVENTDGLVDAMQQVMSLNIHSGTLDKCSVDDLFTFISLKKLSGSLAVNNNGNAISAFFDNGRLYHVESRENPFANRLGSMLVSGGFITGAQLEDALERNRRTGQPLGYILVNAGYITLDKLRGPVKLQMEEQLQKLFSWKHGTFRFERTNLKPYENERIDFEENYNAIIQRLSHTGGSRVFEEAILSHIKTLANPHVSLLTAGGETEEINGMRFVMLLSKFTDILKQHFDIVLVDTPPLLEDPDATLLSSVADGVILVIKSGRLSVKTLKEASTAVKEVNARLSGAVLNHVTS